MAEGGMNLKIQNSIEMIMMMTMTLMINYQWCQMKKFKEC